MKLTKQGVPDLGHDHPNKKPVRLDMDVLERGNCEHLRMGACCFINGRPCDHWWCPDCDLCWDDWAGM